MTTSWSRVAGDVVPAMRVTVSEAGSPASEHDRRPARRPLFKKRHGSGSVFGEKVAQALRMDADRAAGGLDQSELPESLHERGHARTGGADDLRELLVRDALVEPQVRAFRRAELLREVEEHLRQ